MKKLAGLLVVLLSVAPGLAQKNDTDKKAPVDYYPLKAGTKWHYQVTVDDGPVANVLAQVGKIDKKEGVSIVRQETVVQGKVVASEDLSSTAKGVFRHRFNDLEITPPICLLKLPVKKGDTWQTEAKIGEQKAKLTCTVDMEEIKVPAGKYKTVKVKVDAEVDGNTVTTTYWFAPNVGVVKQVADLGGKKINVELEKLEAGK